jgi:hypothetical protein
MQNAEGGGVSARFNDRYRGFGSIVSDIVSSIEPRCPNARAAFNTSNASLKVTFHLPLDSRTSKHGTDEAAEYDLRSARLVGCARTAPDNGARTCLLPSSPVQA